MHTNNHLKNSIGQLNNFMRNHNEPPADLGKEFITELRISNLLLPAKIKVEGITFPHLETDEGMVMLPLFTDEEALSRYTRDFNPVVNDFEYYAMLVAELKFDGIVINPHTDDFFIASEMIRKVPPMLSNISKDGYGAEKLKAIADEAENRELLAFISNDDNFNKFDRLSDIMKESCLLNVVACEDSVTDEVIEKSEVGGFVLSTFTSGDGVYCTMFTGKNAISVTADRSRANYYCQVSNMIEIFKYVLTTDMEGIIINPGLQEYYIPRNVIIDWIDDEGFLNRNLSAANDYAFRI